MEILALIVALYAVRQLVSVPTSTPAPTTPATPAYVPPAYVAPAYVPVTTKYPFLDKYIGHDLTLTETHKLRDAIDTAFLNTKWSYAIAVAMLSVLATSIKPASRWHFWIYPVDLKTGKIKRSDDVINGTWLYWVTAKDSGDKQQKYGWRVVMRWNPEDSKWANAVAGAVKWGGKALDATAGAFLNNLFGIDIGGWIKAQFKNKEQQAQQAITSAISNLDMQLGRL